MSLRRVTRFQEALEAASDAIAELPNESILLNERGLAAFALVRLDIACADWRRSAELGDAKAKEYVGLSCN